MESMGNQAELGGGEAAKRVEKKTKTESNKPKENFISLFNARYGSVVEFMDLEGDEGMDGKFFNRRSGTKWSKKNKKIQDSDTANNANNKDGGKSGIRVVGTMSRCKSFTSASSILLESPRLSNFEYLDFSSSDPTKCH